MKEMYAVCISFHCLESAYYLVVVKLMSGSIEDFKEIITEYFGPKRLLYFFE